MQNKHALEVFFDEVSFSIIKLNQQPYLPFSSPTPTLVILYAAKVSSTHTLG